MVPGRDPATVRPARAPRAEPQRRHETVECLETVSAPCYGDRAVGYGLNEAAADFLLLAVVGANCYMGWHYGLVRRAIAFAAIFGATASATYVGNPLASAIKPGDLYANAWAFVGIFAVVVVMIEILAALYAEQLQKLVTVVFDRVTGFLAGAVVGVLQAGVLFLVAQAVATVPPSAPVTVSTTHADAAAAVDHGLLTQFVVKIEPGIQTLLSPALPSSLEGRFAEAALPSRSGS
jgi:uncharacterized membrane protein required for colicin V production